MNQFQNDMAAWGLEVLGSMTMNDQRVRAYRFLEEALELAQACGVTTDNVDSLVDYTFAHPVGEVDDEIGGTLATIALLATSFGYNLDLCAAKQLSKIQETAKIAKIRSKISSTVPPA